MRPLTPCSCRSRLNSSRTASPPLSAQQPFGLPGSRRLVQTKTCLSRCGSAIGLQSTHVLTPDPPLQTTAQQYAHPVLVLLDDTDAQAGVGVEAGAVVDVRPL